MPEKRLNDIYKSDMSRKKDYKEKNYINIDIELTWDNFEQYYQKREKKLLAALKDLLQ